MAKDETGQDLAVILFSGHGATFPDFEHRKAFRADPDALARGIIRPCHRQ
jgi:hypothetical protein